MKQIEQMLRQKGADYYKITRNEGNNVQNYGQYDLIWKYHGAGEDFVVYVDFDWAKLGFKL